MTTPLNAELAWAFEYRHQPQGKPKDYLKSLYVFDLAGQLTLYTEIQGKGLGSHNRTFYSTPDKKQAVMHLHVTQKRGALSYDLLDQDQTTRLASFHGGWGLWKIFHPHGELLAQAGDPRRGWQLLSVAVLGGAPHRYHIWKGASQELLASFESPIAPAPFLSLTFWQQLWQTPPHWRLQLYIPDADPRLYWAMAYLLDQHNHKAWQSSPRYRNLS